MRQQFVETISGLLKKDKRLVLLLGDIGVWGFRQAFKDFPNRVYNIGILEQASVSLAAGLAKIGLIPVFSSIAPFIVERALEQIKIDFGYQGLGGNLVSVGASYDYSDLGSTHHCPGDIGILKQIPDMEIMVPGTAKEFDRLFRQNYANGKVSYFRLSEQINQTSFQVKFGQAIVIKQGNKATVIAVGPMLDPVLEAAKDLEVTVLYYSTVAPFDGEALKKNMVTNKILLCEPYYEGGLTGEIVKACYPRPIIIDQLGVPRQFIEHYGTKEENDKQLGLDVKTIRKRLKRLINE